MSLFQRPDGAAIWVGVLAQIGSADPGTRVGRVCARFGGWQFQPIRHLRNDHFGRVDRLFVAPLADRLAYKSRQRAISLSQSRITNAMSSKS